MARRENSPVDFRQRDMHREIRRSEPALRSAPGVEAHASQHDLHDRRIERVERRSLFRVHPRGKGRGVEHDIKASPGEEGAQGRERRLVLKAGHEDACDREALVAKRPGQRFDRFEIVGEIDGAIEDDEGGAPRPAPPRNTQRRSGRRRAPEPAEEQESWRRSRRREKRGTPPCCQGRPRQNSARSAGPRRDRVSRPRRGARRGADPQAAART